MFQRNFKGSSKVFGVFRKGFLVGSRSFLGVSFGGFGVFKVFRVLGSSLGFKCSSVFFCNYLFIQNILPLEFSDFGDNFLTGTPFSAFKDIQGLASL